MRQIISLVLFIIALVNLEAFAFTVSYEQTTSGSGMSEQQREIVKINDKKLGFKWIH